MHRDNSRVWIKFNCFFVTRKGLWAVPPPFVPKCYHSGALFFGDIKERDKGPDHKRLLPGAIVKREGLESEACILLAVGFILVLLCWCCLSTATPKSSV